jgi:hypothetical protein
MVTLLMRSWQHLKLSSHQKVAHHSPSLRPQHTVMLLADFLHKSIVQTHVKGEENALAAMSDRLLELSSGNIVS